MFGLTTLLLLVAGAVWFVRYRTFDSYGYVGIDYQTFVAWGHRWLDTGSLYLASQFAPFDAQPMPPVPALLPAMYPPLAGPVFAALTVLPGVLWWMPVVIVAGLVISWRPAPWTWPLIALLLAWPNVSSVVIVGGSAMWIAALVALGLRYGWPAALVVLKPTFGPFALIGWRRRSWRWVVVAEILLTVVMLSETVRYLAVLANARGVGLLYSVGDLPLLAIPLVAWAAKPSPDHD